ncbi:MAG: glycosyltransferase family 2 protein [Parahaliea sp.]
MSICTNKPVSLSISVVLYNSDLELLARTLVSLHKSLDYARANRWLSAEKIVLVDNASMPAYVDKLRVLLARADIKMDGKHEYLVEAASNKGFGAGHNLALTHCSDSDYHLILNPDVELAEDALVLACRYLAAHQDAVLVAPRAFGGSGEVEYLCKRYPSLAVLAVRALGFGWLRRLFAASLTRYELREQATVTQPLVVPLASGCCMLVRRADLQVLNGFNERYFLYFEDFDLCLRLSQRGHLLLLPSMNIVHHGGYAARKGWQHVRLFLRSGLRFFNEHGWRWL